MGKFTTAYVPALDLPTCHAAKTKGCFITLRNFFSTFLLGGILCLSALLSADKAAATAHSAVLSAGTIPAAAGNICVGATNVIYSFKIVQTGAQTLDDLSFTTTGSATATDITNFVLQYNTSNVLPAAGANVLYTITTGTGAGSHTFGAFTRAMATGSTYYYFISATVPSSGATLGHTVAVSAITSANFTFATAGETYTGSTAAGYTMTIASSPTITSTPTAICPVATTTLSATPTGGTWASSSTAIAVVNSSSGVVTGVAPAGGTATITYTQGGCPATIVQTVNPGPIPITLTPAASYSICPGTSTTVTAYSAAPVPTVVLSNNFNNTTNGLIGQVGGTWTVNNTGTSSNFIANEAADVAYTWGIYPSGSDVEEGFFSIAGDGTPWAGASPYDDYFPMISQLVSPSFSTVGFTSGTIGFNEFLYSYDYFTCTFASEGDKNVEVDYSVNGGASWTPVAPSLVQTGDDIPNSLASTWTAGTYAASSDVTFPLALPAGMLNQPNVMLRWYYNSVGGDWWVIDNVVVQCSPSTLPASVFTWAGPAGLSCTSGCYSNTIAPPTGGLNVYSVSATYLGCTATAPVTVNVVVPPNITGNAPVCIGSTVNLANTMGGGTWSSSNPALATVGATGIVTGVATGNPTITYTIPLGCTTTVLGSVNPLPNVSVFSTSATSACPGTPSAVTINSSTLGTARYTVNYTLGGANTATATTTLNMVSGSGTFNTVAMSTAGTTTVTINSITNITNCSIAPSSGNTASFTVNPAPASIGGTPVVCAGAVTALSDANSGGAWSSGNTAVATVDALGNVNGVSGGIVNITYTLPTGCNIASPVTVNSVPAISGISAVCFGQTTTLSDAASAGTWSSTNTTIATIGSGSGFVTGGTTVGTTTISYTSTVNSCAATLAFGVTNTPGVFTVTGGGAYCSGGTGMHIGLTGSNPDVSYQLYVSGTTPVGSAVLGTGGTVDFGAQTITGTYTVIANPGTACATTMAGNATISTYSLPNGSYTVGGGGSFCSGGIGFHITLSNSDFGINYQLFDGTLPIGTPVAGVGGLLTFPLQTASGVYTVVAINPTTGCTQHETGSATITNNPLPGVYIVSGGGAFCASPGATGVAINLSNSDAGTSYSIYNSGVFVTSVTGTGSALSLGLETNSGTYTVTATSASPASCFSNMTGSAVVTANPIPTAANVINGGAYCAGGTGVHVGLNGSQVGVSYQLRNTSVATGSPIAGTSFPLDFGLQTATGVYTVFATNATTGCTNTMNGSVTVTTNPLPVSTYSVTGGGSYCTGGTGVAIGLSGSTSGVSYQLYNGSTPTGIIVTGTGSAIPFGTITTAGTYYVIATITATGCTATMTGNATVIINIPPPVYNVVGGGNYCIGGTGEPVALSGSTSGVTYQLYNGATMLIGDTLDGTGYSLNFGLLTPTGSYNIVATNEATGCTSNMTGSAIIAINPLPVKYTVTGGGGYCPGGTGVHVGLSGSDMGVNYTLIIGTIPSAVMAGTGGTLDFGLETTLTNYIVTASNATTGCNDTMSGFASVSNNLPPAVYPVTSSASSYCAGGSGVAIGIGGSSPLATYQLYLNNSPVGAPVTGTGSGFNFLPNQTAAGLYTVIATNPFTYCTSNMGGSATVSINPLPVAFTVTGSGGYCAGAAGVPVGLSGSSTGVSYQLVNSSGTAIGSSVTGTGSAFSFGIDTVGTYTVLATNATTSCSVNMFSSAVVVKNALPTAYGLSGGGNYCAGGTGRMVGMLSSNIGINYQLYVNGVAVGTPVAGTGAAFNFGLETAPGSYTVVATNTSTGCVNNMTGADTITILPLPTADTVTGGGDYCSGGTGVVVGLSSSSPGVSYQLLNGGTLVGGPVSGGGAAINFGLQLAAGTYTVAASSATTCTNNMYGSATVIINPLPTVYYITGGGAHCPGSAGNHILLNSSDLGISYQLQIGGISTGSSMAGTGAFLDFGSQSTAGVYTVLATNTTTGCTKTMSGSTTVSVSPLPAVDTVTGGGNYCPGGTGVAVTLSSSSAGVNYQLMHGSAATGSAVAGTGMMLTLGTETALGTYSVIATDTTTGCSTDMYGSTTVGNYPLPATFVVSGGGNYCPGGTGVPVITGGSETGVTYQLFDGGVMEGGPLTGTGTGLNFGSQTATGTYTVVATNTATTCSSNMTGSATISTYPLPPAYDVAGGGNYCTGGTGVSVSLVGSNSGINYQLYNNGSAVGGTISGTGAGLNFGLQTTPGDYTVIATNAITGCTNNMADTAIVSIRPLPVVYAVSSSGSSYCAGGDGVDIYISNSDLGVNYQLYLGGTMVGVPVLGSGSALDFGAQTATGIYTVVAIDASAGCMSNMSGSASVSIKPLPAVYNVIGGGGYCAGGAGQHIGLNNSAAGISYQLWLDGATVGLPVAGTGAALDLGAQTTSGSYSVMATNTVSGCSNTMSGTATISINPLPGVYPVTGGGSYCEGGSGVPIGLDGSDGGDVTYQLSRSGILVGLPLTATGSALSFGAQTTAGTYIVTATNTTTSCSAVMASSATVSINTPPAAYTLTGGGGYCEGGTGVPVGLSGSVSGVHYQLYRAGIMTGSSVPGTGGILSFGTETVAGAYTVVATNDATSCSGNMTGAATVTINLLPTVDNVIGGGNYCPGASGVHVGLDGSTSGVLYTLSLDGIPVTGGTISGTGSPADFGLQIGVGTYTVSATNPGTGCTSNMAGSASVGISTPVTPTVSISTGTGDTVCSGTSTTFAATVTNGGSTPSYQWSVNGVLASYSSAYTYIPMNGDNVSLSFTSSAACATPAMVTSSLTISVLNHELPAVSVTTTPGSEVCQGTLVGLTASPSYGGTTPSYQWVVNAVAVPGVSGPYYSYAPVQGDVVYAEMSSNYPCRLANVATSGNIIMTVDSPVIPVVTITASPSAHVGPGQPVTLTATIDRGGGPDPTFQWFINGTAVAGAVSSTFTAANYSNLDSVSLQVTSSGPCSGLVGFNSLLIYTNEGVNQITNSSSDIVLIPNPNKGVFTVKGSIGALADEEVSLEVYDILGQVIYKNTTMAHNGNVNEQIQLNGNLANGMYILNLRSSSLNNVFHFVVEQ